MIIEILQTSAQLYTVKKRIVGWVEELNPTINPIPNSGIVGKFESLVDNEKLDVMLK
jgi:hypothetical protein